MIHKLMYDGDGKYVGERQTPECYAGGASGARRRGRFLKNRQILDKQPSLLFSVCSKGEHGWRETNAVIPVAGLTGSSRDSVNAGLLRLRRMNVMPAGEGAQEYFRGRGRHNSLKRLKTAKEIKANQS